MLKGKARVKLCKQICLCSKTLIWQWNNLAVYRGISNSAQLFISKEIKGVFIEKEKKIEKDTVFTKT